MIALREWKTRHELMGITINSKPFFTLNFADDRVVFTQDSHDFKFLMERLCSAYAEWVLKVSLKKSDSVVNSDASCKVLINEDVLERQVECFKYLGVTCRNMCDV